MFKVIAPFSLAVMALASAPAVSAVCSAQSGATAPAVIELYTSEGCSSCPPADHWLSTLKSRPDVVALAFHVDYWDRLGWVDRFASPIYTQRQQEVQRNNKASFIYTPQVVADGRDWRRWSGGSLPSAKPSTVDVKLEQIGTRVEAVVTARGGAPSNLAAYWAVLEDGHESVVKAGENNGVTLKHDHVVRRYQPVAAWGGGEGARRLQFDAGPAQSTPRRVALVIHDARSGVPVQAVQLSCPS